MEFYNRVYKIQIRFFLRFEILPGNSGTLRKQESGRTIATWGALKTEQSEDQEAEGHKGLATSVMGLWGN